MVSLQQPDRSSEMLSRLEFPRRHHLFGHPNILDMLHSKEIFHNFRCRIFPIEMAKDQVRISSRISRISPALFRLFSRYNCNLSQILLGPSKNSIFLDPPTEKSALNCVQHY